MTAGPRGVLSCVVIAGGGTAGHVVPALPVVEALLEAGSAVHFVGSTSGLEERLVAPLGIPYHGIQAGKLRRYFSFENFVDSVRVPLGIVQAWRLLARIRPVVVFSKGGFVSFPVVVAAWLNGIPVVAHESDLTPGLATRLAQRFTTTLCVNFEGTRAEHARMVVTGTPLRRELLRGDRARGRQRLGIDAERPILLAVGGSLGAARLNEVLRAALHELLVDYDVVHVCGAGKIDASLGTLGGYFQREYVTDEWGDIIAAADVVLSRAGANALYEWLVLGKPHILVPLSRAASRGDQVENAAYAESRGWSMVLAEDDLNSETLVAGVAKLAALSGEFRHRMREFRVRDSASLIVNELSQAARPN
ncbi:MAG: undecaprenyldiphospho-muramoylpentapeptide beta-N-acetylglucosaminyltransferase [Gammaproteobacteria bacterium]|nr:undecaprenyldiphospho-muramoylpentapeptide beta-N-acetylglucosaminyltransferase [Gammaproteobacteria bacterium]